MLLATTNNFVEDIKLIVPGLHDLVVYFFSKDQHLWDLYLDWVVT
jgi:hypothetical protein